MATENHISFVSQFVENVRNGYFMLDETAQNEVRNFVESCQNPDGAFTDRGGNLDFYYSLFGVFIASALDLTDLIDKHKKFIQQAKLPEKEGVTFFSYTLIRSFLIGNNTQKSSVLKLTRMLFSKNGNVNPGYRLFMWMLTFNFLYGKRLLILFPARILLTLHKPTTELPCSVVAAYTVARHFSGLNVNNELKMLFSFFEKGKGFKMFRDVNHPDLLSTAVALFALKTAGADLRIVVPDCLNMVQENYADGAFLSGDGDTTRDLEYTFYGLLTLGVLSQYEQN